MIRHTLMAAIATLGFATSAATQDFAITNATLATGDGSDPIEGATIVVRNGRVADAGTGLSVPAGVPAMDGTGAWVTPGLFATVTDLGLWDVGAVSESNDSRADDSPFSAALDVSPAINPQSQHVKISRAGGITRAAVATMPSSSIFGGQGAIIDTGDDADPIVRARAFQVVALGEGGARRAGGSRVSAHALFRNALREARQYGTDSRITGTASRPPEQRSGDDLPLDLRLVDNQTQRGDDVLLSRFDAAALVPVVNGSQKLYVMVERAADIRAVLALRDEFPQLDLVLVGASEGWLVAGDIAAAGVPVIADALDDLPGSFEELGATQSNVGRMVRAGVKVALNASAMEQPRYLPQFAGNLVALSNVPGAAGLSWGQAFAAISSVPAQISGMSAGAGTLTAGAMGDIVVWDGDPLEVSSTPVKVYIDGIEQPLTNHQTRLAQRYRDLDESDLPKAYDW